MRKCRYQKGSVKKQRGRWVAMWWVDRTRKSRVIGLVKDMTKSDARAVVDKIVTEVNAKREQNRAWRFGEFVGYEADFRHGRAEGHIERNPALLLFTPKEAAKPVRRVMNIKEVQMCFAALDPRERLIAKLAVIAGRRPGEIFALTWGRLTATYADIRQRVYRGTIDTPKTDQSVRKAALPEGLLREIEVWREFAVETRDDAWVFPSERMTVLSKDNCWRRSMQPKLEKMGLGWANFLVMRRTHATLMKGARGGWEAGCRSARP
jgi:integrase